MSRYSASDYTDALQALMPTGLVWPRQIDSVQTAVLRALAQSFQRNDEDAADLIIGAFPATATTLLAEWESTLGLPDLCSIGEINSVPQRQRNVVDRLTATGGQSKNYFIQVAATLGYTITITEFRQACVGMSVCGDALNGEEWPFTWLVTAPETTVLYAQSGISYCGDPLRSWGNQQLECRLTAISPSHTIVLFGYVN
ncbi:YmfQ family protein [Budviciaceae bacterium CWB-B4]|uniref:YmfQ family protein n=1 Tax=Limnobaculum xujianqingii TaxID=2738837 RepID=A0A9D7FZR6_9GAMM|nr:YmfQ family protein [Limnobaculum xujianqingii]MBK5075080.1 YmfQ family protein [Limnobaculum xujianqingii]MBK5178385.1 YmfQ family protein [Limnobaculum xujianqingii]